MLIFGSTSPVGSWRKLLQNNAIKLRIRLVKLQVVQGANTSFGF